MPVSDNINSSPTQTAKRIRERAHFSVAAIGLDHDHIYGMCDGLAGAGADICSVYDPDPVKVAAFCKHFPSAKPSSHDDAIFENESIDLIASAAIPADRAAIGLRAMQHGKDYFVDKPPFTTLGQLAAARATTQQTGRKYGVYYSERLHVEAAVFAGQLLEQGAIGRVIQVIGAGPHRLNAPSRPAWSFDRSLYGGILCDIGSHQIEQFLFFADATDAEVTFSRVANYAHKAYPNFEDFGECSLLGSNGAVGYLRVDWLTPQGLSTWGDGRTLLLGTDGYIELRKYVDIAHDSSGDHVYLVDHRGEHHFSVAGTVGYPFFEKFIRDCLEGTEGAMSQNHAFKAAELAIIAQMQALRAE